MFTENISYYLSRKVINCIVKLDKIFYKRTKNIFVDDIQKNVGKHQVID